MFLGLPTGTGIVLGGPLGRRGTSQSGMISELFDASERILAVRSSVLLGVQRRQRKEGGGACTTAIPSSMRADPFAPWLTSNASATGGTNRTMPVRLPPCACMMRLEACQVAVILLGRQLRYMYLLPPCQAGELLWRLGGERGMHPGADGPRYRFW